MSDSTGPSPRQRELTACGMAVAHWAEVAPDRAAILSSRGDRTFAELNARANQLVRALRRRGLAAGDGVALVCANRPEFVEVWAACERGGFRLTAINWHLTGGEAAYVVEDSQARALIVDDAALGSQMLYTSGTTGRPKGVFRDEASLATAVMLARAAYREGNVHLLTGPLYHAAPLLFSMNAPLIAGVPVVLMPAWDPEEALRLIERHRITHTHMVPTMFHQLLALPDDVRGRYDVSSLRNVLHGAAPCPVGVKQRLIEWLGPVVNEYYAATEGLGTWVDARTWLQKPGTVGKPVPADQVVVADEEANPLPAGEVGLVWFKASEVPFEYYKDRSKTESSYRERHFTLGDMGYVDDDGFLFLTDRSANLIISGGVNIYPAEVDAVLLDHPVVADAAVIGVPNPEWGEDVLAVVELRAGAEQNRDLADELVDFCRDRLAHYKCPRRVEFVEQLPRQDNGKIYKRLLRDRYRERAST